MAEKAGCSFVKTIAPGSGNSKNKSHVRVACGQHRVEAGHFHLATGALARLLVMAMGAHFFQSAFTVQPLLESAQRLVDRLAFFQLNLCQFPSLPSGGSDRDAPSWRPAGRIKVRGAYGPPPWVSTGNPAPKSPRKGWRNAVLHNKHRPAARFYIETNLYWISKSTKPA